MQEQIETNNNQVDLFSGNKNINQHIVSFLGSRRDIQSLREVNKTIKKQIDEIPLVFKSNRGDLIHITLGEYISDYIKFSLIERNNRRRLREISFDYNDRTKNDLSNTVILSGIGGSAIGSYIGLILAIVIPITTGVGGWAGFGLGCLIAFSSAGIGTLLGGGGRAIRNRFFAQSLTSLEEEKKLLDEEINMADSRHIFTA